MARWIDLAYHILLGAAIGLNLAAAARNRRLSARYRKDTEEVAKLIAFAAFMSREESGAPDAVRAMARWALPQGLEINIDFEPIPDASDGTVH